MLVRVSGMHAGLSLVFQNLDGQMSDAEMYRHELALAARRRGRSASTRCGRPSTTSPTTS